MFARVVANRSYTIDDLLKVRRVGDPQLSPDGRHVAFTIGDVNFADNRVVNQIYVTSIDGGGELKRLTAESRHRSAPRWSPDGKKIAFMTGGQIWIDGQRRRRRQKTGHEDLDWRGRAGVVA